MSWTIFSIISVSFSSGQANFTITAFRPKAMGSSVNEMFWEPSFSRAIFVASFISSRFESGDSGRIFIITAAIPAIF